MRSETIGAVVSLLTELRINSRSCPIDMTLLAELGSCRYLTIL